MTLAGWLVGAGLVVPVILIPLLTLSYDEAWVLGGTANIALEGRFGIGDTMGSNSTGGVYSLGQTLIAHLFGRDLTIARAFVYVTLLLMVREAVLIAKQLAPVRWIGTMTALAIVATPGVLFFGAIADAVIPATWLSLFTTRVWCFARQRDHRWILHAGMLLGLCVATRLNFVFLLPALAATSLLNRNESRPLRPALLAIALACGVATTNFAVHIWLSDRTAAEAGEFAAYASGLSELLANLHPNLLTMKVMSIHEAMPLGLLATNLVLVTFCLRERGRTARGETILALSLFSVVLLSAWLSVGKLLLRYYLPSAVILTALLPACVGIALSNSKTRIRIAIFGIVSVFLTGQLLGELTRNFRIGLNGDADRVIDQLTLQREMDGLYSLRAKRTEREIASFLKQVDEGTALVTYGPDDLPMAYLIGRPIPDVSKVTLSESDPVLIVIRPRLGRNFEPPPAAAAWFASECRLEMQSGSSAVFRMTGQPPADPRILHWREY